MAGADPGEVKWVNFHPPPLFLNHADAQTSNTSTRLWFYSFACRHPRCRTCLFTSSNVHVDARAQLPSMNASPANQITLYTASRAVDAPSIGETGRTLHERFGEHLRSVQKNTGGFPVAEHLNSPGHSLSDIAVRGLRRCSGASFRRKQLEMQLIFRLGTMQPNGLNNVFHFL